VKNKLPVYGINEFQLQNDETHFYANYLNPHVKQHHFANLPHKHDFYLTVLFTKGEGKHEVDFESFKIVPGMLFMLKPGQMHYWDLSDDVEGYVFFHSKEFYDDGFTNSGINDFDFFGSIQNPSVVQLKQHPLQKISLLMNEMVTEYKRNEILKWQKTRAIMNLIYIEIARNYSSVFTIESERYLIKIQQFEQLIERYFKQSKSVRYYASELCVSEKHLNRIIRSCLNKTTSQLINERVLLEAKRMLMTASNSVGLIAEELGFSDTSYFIRFFKKHTGVTPLHFLNSTIRK